MDPILFSFVAEVWAIVFTALFPFPLVLLVSDRRTRLRPVWGILSILGAATWVQWGLSGALWPLLDRVPMVNFHRTALPFPGMAVKASTGSDDQMPEENVTLWLDEPVVTRVNLEGIYLVEGDDLRDLGVGFMGLSGTFMAWDQVVSWRRARGDG